MAPPSLTDRLAASTHIGALAGAAGLLLTGEARGKGRKALNPPIFPHTAHAHARTRTHTRTHTHTPRTGAFMDPVADATDWSSVVPGIRYQEHALTQTTCKAFNRVTDGRNVTAVSTVYTQTNKAGTAP